MNYQEALLLLGLRSCFNEEQLKKAYRKLMKKYHPDLYENKSQAEKSKAEELAKKINEAYNVLLKSLNGTNKSSNYTYYDFNLENKKAEFIKYFKDILKSVNQEIPFKFRKQEKDIITVALYNINKARSMQELQNAFSQAKADLNQNNVSLFNYYLASYMPHCQKFFLQLNLIITAYKKTLNYQDGVSDAYRHFKKMQEEIEKTIKYYQKIYREQIEKRVSAILEMVLNSNSSFINKLSKNDLSLLKKALNEEKEEIISSLLCIAEQNCSNSIESELEYEYSNVYAELEAIIKKYKTIFEINQSKVLELINSYKNSDEKLKIKLSEVTKLLLENLLSDNFDSMYNKAVKSILLENKLDFSKIKKSLLAKFSKVIANIDTNNKYHISLLTAEFVEINQKLSQPDHINFEFFAELNNISFVDLKTDAEIIKRVFTENINFNQDKIFIDNDGNFVSAFQYNNKIYVLSPSNGITRVLESDDFSKSYTSLSSFLEYGIFIGKENSEGTIVLYVNKNFGICYNPLASKKYFIDTTEHIFSTRFNSYSLNYDAYKDKSFMILALENYFGLHKQRLINDDDYKEYNYNKIIIKNNNYNKINNEYKY